MTDEAAFLKAIQADPDDDSVRLVLSDDGLKHLANLKQLRKLNLNGTQITSKGLSQLNGLANLQQLDIRWMSFDPIAIQGLQNALPDCEIFWNSPRQ